MIVKSTTTAYVSAEDAQRISADFVADNLGDQIGTGTPWRVVSPLRSAWVVPLLLTSPGYGIAGIVGALVIDEELGTMVAWTTPEEIEANAERLAEAKALELQSAFNSARAKDAA